MMKWLVMSTIPNRKWLVHIPCKRFPRKYFDQSVFWSSMTSRVKQRSLLKAWTRDTVDAAAPIRLAPWSRAAPVKLWTRCNKLSRDFAGLDGADVPSFQNPMLIEVYDRLNSSITSCWPLSKTQWHVTGRCWASWARSWKEIKTVF